MLPLDKVIFLLFFPACVGLLTQVIWGIELTNQLVASGTFIFCIEQARMAVKDLRQIEDAKALVQDVRLDTFYQVTLITIAVELLGFYISIVWLGWGSIVILLSQIWFNLLASVKIQYPNQVAENILKVDNYNFSNTSALTLSAPVLLNAVPIYVRYWKISERLPVLIADILGLVLISFWMLQIGSLFISWALFAMVIVYGIAKLILLLSR
ncbi:hypothetical protein NIES4071_11900 [Calothrix sp. NIES-4071]|nr:hypothetical protein NIES4071_11900 [Calothrix sp. NIES-4071]BAZ55530.1 hypothetical protein NIES4105_11860 [Calothrix sp. NIES-4105]